MLKVVPVEESVHVADRLETSWHSVKNEQQNMTEVDQAPQLKSCTKVLDMEPGEYVCVQFARTKYRSLERTVLFLLPANSEEMRWRTNCFYDKY